jgi:hypothetical protein
MPSDLHHLPCVRWLRIQRPLLAARRGSSRRIPRDGGGSKPRTNVERGRGQSAQQLIAFDAKRLSELKRPWGDRQQKVGKKAEKVLMFAEVLCSGKERILGPAVIPKTTGASTQSLEP